MESRLLKLKEEIKDKLSEITNFLTARGHSKTEIGFSFNGYISVDDFEEHIEILKDQLFELLSDFEFLSESDDVAKQFKARCIKKIRAIEILLPERDRYTHLNEKQFFSLKEFRSTQNKCKSLI